MSLQTGSRLTLAALLTAGLLATPALASEVYQWKDAQGVTHYSDTPPPAGSDHSVRQISQAGTASRAAAAEPADAPPESEACLTAKSNLNLLRSDGPVGEDTDGDGIPDSELDAAQRQAQLQLAEASIRVHCGGGGGSGG